MKKQVKKHAKKPVRKRSRSPIFLVLILVAAAGAYLWFLWNNLHPMQTDQAPSIQVPSGTLELSVAAEESDMEAAVLTGVTASDPEDGDLTGSVFVENMSKFDENGLRQVTLGVFDSHDNYASAVRYIAYTDYTAPVISLKKPLIYTWIQSKTQFADYITATSSVDGDISSQVKVLREYQKTDDDSMYVDFSVTDSTGTESTLTLKAYQIDRDITLDIELTDYLIRVPVGTVISNPEQYVESVKFEKLDITSNVMKNMEITTDYDPNTPGTYEFTYRAVSSSGDYGYTKLVVIVEGD